MKKILLAIALVLMTASFSFAASLQWGAVTTNTDGSAATLSGYNAYDVTGTRAKINTTIIPNSACVSGTCTWAIPVNPTDGKKYVVTAVGTNGQESGDSNIATYRTTPNNPAGLIIKFP